MKIFSTWDIWLEGSLYTWGNSCSKQVYFFFSSSILSCVLAFDQLSGNDISPIPIINFWVSQRACRTSWWAVGTHSGLQSCFWLGLAVVNDQRGIWFRHVLWLIWCITDRSDNDLGSQNWRQTCQMLWYAQHIVAAWVSRGWEWEVGVSKRTRCWCQASMTVGQILTFSGSWSQVHPCMISYKNIKENWKAQNCVRRLSSWIPPLLSHFYIRTSHMVKNKPNKGMGDAIKIQICKIWHFLRYRWMDQENAVRITCTIRNSHTLKSHLGVDILSVRGFGWTDQIHKSDNKAGSENKTSP